MKLTLSIRSGQVGGLKRGLEHTFDETGGLIGRNASCDWQIEDATRTLSGRHATITYRDGHFYVTDTSTNGVFVGDSNEPVGRGRSVEIDQGTRLRFGDYMVVATIQQEGRSSDSRAAPRISIAPETAPRGLSTDPLDMLGEGTEHEALSIVPERSRPTGFQSAPGRGGANPGQVKDDTLGSFFGSNAPQRKDDPFSDLGKSSTGIPGGSGGGKVGTDWLSADTAYAHGNTTGYAPVRSPAAAQPQPTPDLGSRLSDALASELDGPSSEPVRPSVRQSPRDATEITSYTRQTQSPASAATTGGGTGADAALPHDLSWEDLLGGGAPAGGAPTGAILSPMSPSPSGAGAVPPLPPMEDLLGSSAMPSAATSVPQPEAGGRATEPSSARTVVPPAQDAGPARRERRAPGNNLLSDLVSPATGGGAQRVPSAGAGNSLDPVSVLRQRASHRSTPTQYVAEAAAPVAVPTPAAETVGRVAPYDAVLQAAGIDPASVPEADREAVACEIGRTAKAAASGLSDVLAARRLFKEEFRLDRTRIQPEQNNPFKFYKTGAEALSKAAAGTETGFLSVSAGMSEGFTELKAHELASVTAMQEAIATVLAKLDPSSIQAEDAAGGFFGRGDGKALWERYKELHAGLSQDPEATSRKIVSEQFLRAYEKTLATLRAKDRP
jgi:type VI secretion system FHA domain protein